MTLKNNRAHLLCYFQLCASFHSHQWIQTGVRVQKHPIWVKIGHFLAPVTLKFNGWPWKPIGHLSYATSSFVTWLDLTCASFHSHQWIQTAIRVRKRPIRVKIGHFLAPVTLKFNGWPWKTIGHLSYATSSFVHHFIAISEFKLELVRKRQIQVKICFDLCDLDLWPLTLTFCMDITSVHGNNSWKFHDDTMMGT